MTTRGPGDGGPIGVTRLVRDHRRWIVTGIVLTLAASALGMAQPLVAVRVIEGAAAGAVPWAATALLVALFTGGVVLQVAVRYVLGRTGEGVVLGVRLRLADHLLRLPIPSYDRFRTGDLIARVGNDSAALQRIVAEGCTDAVTGTVGLAAAVALMFWLDPVLSALAMGLTVAGTLLLLPLLSRMRAVSAGLQDATGELTADMERALGAIRTVRAGQAEGRESRRIADRSRQVYTAGVRMVRLNALAGPATQLAVHGSFLVVLLVGGVRAATGAGSVADLVAFLLYMLYLTGPIGALFEAISVLQQGSGALRRINQILTLPTETGTAPAPAAHLNGSAPDRARAAVLEFRDVWFGYRPDRPVLRGVSFHVPPRGHLALVGPSGAGKSTVLALAERFYDPDRGQVLFAGHDVRALERGHHRAAIGLVEQHAPVLYGTLRDNLGYTAPDASDDELDRVIELANLAELVSRLPDGLDTDVGEHGRKLSGGERQRIALARSLLRRPRLLLLDEPTAHLDPANEAAFHTAVRRVSAACALLVITHRFATARAADHILVLDQGVIVAAGSHEELQETSPYYRHLSLTRHHLSRRA
ncbi:ABC transporter ATP-binding protein [Actinomadura kijaniata]|uniref:ABC transporter ATP-binding protein n=1 Tax=Actinomadura kijaniata TaxID=46161 RepID=UPI003F1B56DB